MIRRHKSLVDFICADITTFYFIRGLFCSPNKPKVSCVDTRLAYKEVLAMSQPDELDLELERRLTEIETVEATDPVHMRLSGKSLGIFLTVVLGITVFAWIGASL